MRWWSRFLASSRNGDSAASPAELAPAGGNARIADEATAHEISRVGHLVSSLLGELGGALRPGVTTREVEKAAARLLAREGLVSRMLNYHGFPGVLAASGDDEVLHGIPSNRTLRTGELVKIQLGARGAGGTCDQGWTFGVGEIDAERERLRDVGIAALRAGLDTLRANSRVGDLGAAIQATVEGAGFSCVRAFVGYGIGARDMQAPQLPCVGKAGTGVRLEAGMILHVHAIVAAGGYEVEIAEDGWTARTRDGRPSAIFTAVARLESNGYAILTPLLG